MASIDVLEGRLRKLSAAAADIFRKASPENQANILKSYGIYTGVGGQILQSDRLMAEAARKSLALGPLKGSIFGAYDQSKLQSAARILAPIMPGTPEWMRKLRGSITPQTILDPKLLGQGAKQLMGMGPLETGPNLKLAGMGALVSLFSPWIGARMLNESKLLQSFGRVFGVGGGGGKGGGGISGALFGGGMAGFAEAYLLIRAMQMLRYAITAFTDAVKRGSDLYLHSAMLGTAPGKLSQIQKTFAMLGMSPESAEKMLAMGQFRPGMRMSPAGFQGMVLGASGILNREEMQALMNMSEVVSRAWNMAANSARQSALVSSDLFRTAFVWRQMTVEWNTLLEQMAAKFSGLATIFEMAATGFLHLANIIMEFLDNAPKKAAMLPGIGLPSAILDMTRKFAEAVLPLTDPNKFVKRGLGTVMSRPEGMWERMGLVSAGGIGGTDYARQTAENTKRIADILSGKAPAQSGGGLKVAMAVGSAAASPFGIPFLP